MLAGLAALPLTIVLSAAAAPPPAEGDLAPLSGITGVVDADGGPADLSRVVLPAGAGPSAAPVKATLLVFWASWCHPCVNEIPVLNELARVYGKRGLSIVGLGVREGGETLERLRAAARSHAAAYPIYFDAEGRAQEIFGVKALPMTALIDVAGRLRWVGPSLPADISARIVALLEPGEGRGSR